VSTDAGAGPAESSLSGPGSGGQPHPGDQPDLGPAEAGAVPAANDQPAPGHDTSPAAGSPAHLTGDQSTPDTPPAELPEERTGPIPRVTEAGVSSAVPYGTEDLLSRTPPRRVGPAHRADSAGTLAPPGKARRSPWNRGRDRVLAALIAVVVVVVALVVTVTSDNQHTSRALADPPAALPAPPSAVPGSMTQLWQAPSAATPVPIGQSNTVVTADDGEVAGRDARTGQIRWHYTRDNLQLCTVDTAWGKVNAVYHKSMGCSEVTQLDPATGRITAQRNGDAELGTRLISDGSHVTTTGKRLLDTWRDDLVKTMEYGKVPFLQNANKQPRTDCTYGTVAMAANRVGVIERCPGDSGDRLTVYKATAEHEDEPQVVYTALLGSSGARVVAMSGDLTGVFLPEKQLYVIYNADGSQKAAYPMDLPPQDAKGDPAGGTEQTSSTASAIYWYTGSKTVALSRDDLTPRWTLDRTMGPGITFAGQLVVPIHGGLAVLNEANGTTLRTVGLDRGTYSGPIRLTALGPLLLEQRGPVVAALR
jgi:outer membrane protein assembly factor BamB